LWKSFAIAADYPVQLELEDPLMYWLDAEFLALLDA